MPEEQIGQEEEVEVNQSEVTTDEEPAEELPEDAKERTKAQFDKLKEHNKELAEQLEQLKAQGSQKSALENLANPQMVQAVAPDLSKKQVEDTIQGLVDENGYLDQALLENTLRQANQQVAKANEEAEKANQTAKQALSQVNKFGQDREVRIAHKRFPNVDPESPKYDPAFFKAVKNELLGAMYEGRKIEFVDACREVAKNYSPKKDEGETKAKAVEEYKETVAKKSALNPTGSSRPESGLTKEDLIEGTRKGDANAIAARLANI